MLLLYDYQFSTGLLLLLFGIIISTNSNFDRADWTNSYIDDLDTMALHCYV